MPRKANAPVGTCPCPIHGCSADRAPLMRFKATAKNPADARKAGKYYLRCPNHGWYGYDAFPATQVYIRANGKLNEGETWDTETATPAASSTTSSAPAPSPASSSTSAPKAPRRPKPAPSPKPAPPTPAPAKAPRRDVWDL